MLHLLCFPRGGLASPRLWVFDCGKLIDQTLVEVHKGTILCRCCIATIVCGPNHACHRVLLVNSEFWGSYHCCAPVFCLLLLTMFHMACPHEIRASALGSLNCWARVGCVCPTNRNCLRNQCSWCKCQHECCHFAQRFVDLWAFVYPRINVKKWKVV